MQSTTLTRSLPSRWPSPDFGDWFILRTRARQEKILAQDLAARAIPFFMPLVPAIRYYGGRKARVELPLFPGYVFLRGSRDEACLADRTRRVAQIITVCNQPRLDTELHSLYIAIANQAELDPYPCLQAGVWVEVRSGPFRGLRGVVENRSRMSFVVLQVEMLGRAVSLEIDASLLEVIEEPRATRPSPLLAIGH